MLSRAVLTGRDRQASTPLRNPCITVIHTTAVCTAEPAHCETAHTMSTLKKQHATVRPKPAAAQLGPGAWPGTWPGAPRSLLRAGSALQQITTSILNVSQLRLGPETYVLEVSQRHVIMRPSCICETAFRGVSNNRRPPLLGKAWAAAHACMLHAARCFFRNCIRHDSHVHVAPLPKLFAPDISIPLSSI